MHSDFGPIRQMGYVVRDIRAAMQQWADRLRIGPWYYNEHLPLVHYEYRGTPYEGFEMSYALANSGGMQIELIQQRCDTPSLYRDFLERRGEGLQHFAVWPEDYDTVHALADEIGLVAGQEGYGRKGRFVYYEDAVHSGTSLELAELVPERLRSIAIIRDAAAGWDGSDPIRPFP